MALCATTALAGAVSRLCVRGARGRFGGGSGRYLVLCLSCFPLPAPRVPRCVWRAVPSGCPLPSLAGTPFHAVCAFRALGSVALPVVPACPFRVCALALSRCPLPPPLGGVARASRVVPALGAGRAVPRGPCPSACPAPVPSSVWRAWGGAVRSRFPPTWLGVVGAAAPGRPSSGAGSQGSASRVSRVRSVRAWGLCTGPTACVLAGRRCSLWVWRKGVPGGVPSTVVRGAWCQALSLPRPPVLWSAQPGFRVPCVPGAVGAGVGTHHRLHSVSPCGPALLAVGVAEGRPRGGVLSTVVRGARCQALSLPRPPVLWSGLPGFRDPCVPGAVDAGVWTQHRPHSVRPCGPALLAVGVAEGRAREVLSTVVRGAWCQALSLPRPPILWSGLPGFRDPCVPGAVDAGVWTEHRPPSVRPCAPASLAVGVAEGRPRGGAFHLCEGRLVSGAVPPPAARPLERAAGVPRPVCPGCGRCGRVDPAPAPQRAPLRAGVARCEGGGGASPGGVPSTVS